MRMIEGSLRRSPIARIISLSLIVGMMEATILPVFAQGQIVRASKRQNAMHLAQLSEPPRPVPTPGELTRLIGLLQDADAQVRWNAASALGSFGPGAKAAVPQLLPLLRDNNASVRQIAAYALGEIGPEAKAAVPQLLPLLRDGDESVRVDAILALGKLKSVKETVPQIIPLLQDANKETRLATVLTLKDFRTLKDFDPTKVQEALPLLIQAYYKYQDWDVLDLIVSVGGAKAIATMIANSHDSNVTLNISELADSLAWDGTCQDYSFRKSLAIREVIIPALVDNLKGKKSPDRAKAASIIGQISPAATFAVPALISALSDRDEDIRRAAMEALQRIDLMALRQALIANLQHQDPAIRRTAIAEMQLLTRDAALIAALQDKNKNLRQRAIDDFLKRPLPIPEPPPKVCGAGSDSMFVELIRRMFRRR